MTDYVYKVILAGDSGVGKSTLTNKLMKDYAGFGRIKGLFNKLSNPKKMKLKIDGKYIKLRILDPCGKIGEYKPIMRIMKRYFYDTHGILYIYDLSRPETLSGLQKWKKLNKSSNNLYNECQAILVGNKSDNNRTGVTEEDIKSFIRENDGANIKAHYCMSAKTGEQIEEALIHLVRLILEQDYK
jgi:small GTP-binding protein